VEKLKLEAKEEARWVGSLPVRMIVRAIHRIYPHNCRVGEVLVGALVLLFGAWLAQHEVSWVPHFVWEGIAYAIHGLGVTPIAEEVMTVLRAVE